MSTLHQRRAAPGCAHAADTIAQLGPQMSEDAVTVLLAAGLHADLDDLDDLAVPARPKGNTVEELGLVAVMDEDRVWAALAELVRLGAMTTFTTRTALPEVRYRIPEAAYEVA